MNDTTGQRVPVHRLVAEANQEFSVVQVILCQLAQAGDPVAGPVARYLFELVSEAIRRSGRDESWLRAECDAAEARLMAIRGRLTAHRRQSPGNQPRRVQHERART